MSYMKWQPDTMFNQFLTQTMKTDLTSWLELDRSYMATKDKEDVWRVLPVREHRYELPQFELDTTSSPPESARQALQIVAENEIYRQNLDKFQNEWPWDVCRFVSHPDASHDETCLNRLRLRSYVLPDGRVVWSNGSYDAKIYCQNIWLPRWYNYDRAELFRLSGTANLHNWQYSNERRDAQTREFLEEWLSDSRRRYAENRHLQSRIEFMKKHGVEYDPKTGNFTANAGDDDRHTKKIMLKQKRELKELRSAIRRGEKSRQKMERELKKFKANAGIVDAVMGFYDMVKDVSSGWTAAKRVAHAAMGVLNKFKPHITHVAALIARWYIQAPTPMTFAIDMFILLERISPGAAARGVQSFLAEVANTKPIQAMFSDGPEVRNDRENQFHANAGDEAGSWTAVAAIHNLLKGLGGSIVSASASALFLAKWGKVTRDVHMGAKSFIELVTPLSQMVFDFVRRTIFHEDVSELQLSKIVDLDEFLSKHEILRTATKAEIAETNFVKELLAHWRQAVKVRRWLLTSSEKAKPGIRTLLSKMCEEVHTLYTRHIQRVQQVEIPVRPTPYSFALVGESGCGKSDISMMLLRDMCHPSNCDMDVVSEDFSSLVYTASDTKHYDGYAAHPVYYHDDMGQKKENSNTSKEDADYLRYIKLVSSTRLILPMADLADKGQEFVSRIVAYTSNAVYPVPMGYESKEAIQRRRNKLVYVTYKEGSNVYPEEAVTYVNEDGTEFQERRLPDTCFYLLPPVLKNGDAVVGDSLWKPEDRPRHGQKYSFQGGVGPLSYTELLEVLVTDYNNWMESSNATRLMASMPTARQGFGPKGEKKPSMWMKYRAQDRMFSANAGEDDLPSMPLPDTTVTDTFFETVAKRVGVTTKALANFAFNHSGKMLAILACVFTFAVGAMQIYTHLKTKDDPIPLVAINQFVEQIDPSIREEMRHALLTQNLQLLGIELEANMSTKLGYGDMKSRGGAPTIRPPVTLAGVNDAYAANAGLQNNASLQRILAKNLYTIKCGSMVIQALGVCGRWLLMNEHFFRMVKLEESVLQSGFLPMSLWRDGIKRWEGELNMATKKVIGDDLVLVELPKQCNSSRDIRHFFVDERELGMTENFDGWTTTSLEGFPQAFRARMWLDCQMPAYKCRETPIRVARAYRGKIPILSEGHCGAPLVVEHLNKVCAIHAASDSAGNVMMLPVTRQMLSCAVPDYAFEPPTVPLEECVTNAGEIPCEGITPPTFNNFILDKTDIVASPICGKVVEVRKEPSVKSLRDPRISEEAKLGPQPMTKSFLQSFDVAKDVTNAIWSQAIITMSAILSTVVPLPRLGKRILTEDEVLNGVEGEYVSLNVHTSAGMPQRTYSKLPGKTGFFDRVEVNSMQRLRWGTSEAALRFKADYEAYEAMLKDGTIPFTVLLEQLKDETLKRDKIAKAKTRTFEVFPGPLALIWRKYFGAFCAANQAVCTEKPISVGINAHSIQWKYLYDRLSKFGGDVIAGDYQAWDKRLTGQAIMDGVGLINEWYNDGPVNARVREALAYMIIHSNVLIGRRLYETHQGMPSGVPVTAVLNSVCNGLYLISAIFSILKEEGVDIEPMELLKHMEMALYGDDHILALSKFLSKHVTFAKVAKHFRDRGVGYTDSGKTGREDFDHEKLEEVTYLKRTFHVEGTRVYAPLDKISVEDCLNWVKPVAGRSDFAILEECYETLAIESHLHGREYFDALKDKLNRCLAQCVENGEQCNLFATSYDSIRFTYETRYAEV